MKYRKIKEIPKFPSRLLVKVKDDSRGHNSAEPSNLPLSLRKLQNEISTDFPVLLVFSDNVVLISYYNK